MDADKPKKKFYKQWWFWVIVVLVIIVLAESGNSNAPAQTAATASPDAAQTEAAAPAQSAPAPAKQAAAPAKTTPAPTPAPAPAPHVPVTLLQVSGNGQKSTQTFTAPSSWTLDYSYDCSSFGTRGNFQVYIFNGNGSMALLSGPNELGTSGSDTDYYHTAGTFYLEVNSECSWTVTAKG